MALVLTPMLAGGADQRDFARQKVGISLASVGLLGSRANLAILDLVLPTVILQYLRDQRQVFYWCPKCSLKFVLVGIVLDRRQPATL